MRRRTKGGRFLLQDRLVLAPNPRRCDRSPSEILHQGGREKALREHARGAPFDTLSLFFRREDRSRLPTDSKAKKKAAARTFLANRPSSFKYSPEANDASASATSAMRAATFMFSEEGGKRF